jgi:hypothetical protein
MGNFKTVTVFGMVFSETQKSIALAFLVALGQNCFALFVA